MKRKFSVLIVCCSMLISVTAFELTVCAAAVETVGELKTSGGIRFNDDSLQTSACTGCAGGILSINLGGTGANNALDARTNLAVPGLQTPNTFIADQTVAGTVNATSFSGSGSGLTALNASNLATGTVPDARLPANLARKYGKVAVVAQSGGDYTSPVTAMAGIASWCGTPSATNPCLLKIMPGVYDLGSGSLTMQQYVDIEGSGENITVITGTVSNASSPPLNGVVNGASNAEIRFLTVRNTGTGAYVAAVLNSGGFSPRMTHMTATASGGTMDNYGVYNYASSSPTMNNVTASASGGGGTYSYGVINVSSSSPTMTNVTASASGGGFNCGVYSNTSSPTMSNVSATASGGTINYGVYNTASSSPTMSNVTATASGGTSSVGVLNRSSSPTMSNVTATASGGGTLNFGVENTATSGSYTIKIDRSTFSGSTYSINNDSEFTLRIGATNLSGGPTNAVGTYTCIGVYDGDTYTALNASCQ